MSQPVDACHASRLPNLSGIAPFKLVSDLKEDLVGDPRELSTGVFPFDESTGGSS